MKEYFSFYESFSCCCCVLVHFACLFPLFMLFTAVIVKLLQHFFFCFFSENIATKYPVTSCHTHLEAILVSYLPKHASFGTVGGNLTPQGPWSIWEWNRFSYFKTTVASTQPPCDLLFNHFQLFIPGLIFWLFYLFLLANSIIYSSML